MNLKNKVRAGALAAITIPAIIGSTLTVPRAGGCRLGNLPQLHRPERAELPVSCLR